MSSIRVLAAAALLTVAACGPDDGQPVPSAPPTGETTAMSSSSLTCTDSKQGLCEPVPHWPTWFGAESRATGKITVGVVLEAAHREEVVTQAARAWEKIAAEWLGRDPVEVFRVVIVDAASAPYLPIYVGPDQELGDFRAMTGWSWDQGACRMVEAKITFDPSEGPDFGVAFHEFGHALGIPHREESEALSCNPGTCEGLDSCELLDLERAHAARAIFGVGAGPTFGL